MSYTVTHRAQKHPSKSAAEAMALAEKLAAQANGLVLVTSPDGRTRSVRDFRAFVAEEGG